VEKVLINDFSVGSIGFIGDCVEVTPKGKALAVQRQISTFSGKEGDFSQFPTFSRPIPQPSPSNPVRMEIANRDPFINVRALRIFSVTASSVMQIGSNERIESEFRLKHIRQLQSRQGIAAANKKA